MRIILSQITNPIESFVKLAKEIDKNGNHTSLDHFLKSDDKIIYIRAGHRLYDTYRIAISHAGNVDIEISHDGTLKDLTPAVIKTVALEFKKRVKALAN